VRTQGSDAHLARPRPPRAGLRTLKALASCRRPSSARRQLVLFEGECGRCQSVRRHEQTTNRRCQPVPIFRLQSSARLCHGLRCRLVCDLFSSKKGLTGKQHSSSRAESHQDRRESELGGSRWLTTPPKQESSTAVIRLRGSLVLGRRWIPRSIFIHGTRPWLA